MMNPIEGTKLVQQSLHKFASPGMRHRVLGVMYLGVWYSVEDIRRHFMPPVTVARHYLWSHSTTHWVLRSLQARGIVVRQKVGTKYLYRLYNRYVGDPT